MRENVAPFVSSKKETRKKTLTSLTEVACEANDSIFEIYFTALTVRDAALVEDLEEDHRDVFMSFFEFIQ
jgi:hypothetical protein